MADTSGEQEHANNDATADQDPSAGLDAPNEFEASLEADINPEGADPTAMNVDGASQQDKDIPALGESRIAAKKDATLREFLSKMDDYSPIIPDAVTNYYLTLAGLPPPPQTPVHLARLLALATQKFIADIAADAYQYSRIRSTNTTSNNPLTGLGGAAGFGTGAGGGGGAGGAGGLQGGGAGGGLGQDGAGKGGKDGGAAGKGAPLGGPRAGFGGTGTGAGGGRTVLTMEDLGMAVGEYGVNVRRGEFYR